VLVILFDNPSDLDVTHQEGHCMKSGPYLGYIRWRREFCLRSYLRELDIFI